MTVASRGTFRNISNAMADLDAKVENRMLEPHCHVDRVERVYIYLIVVHGWQIARTALFARKS
jgi:hypothetical protein